PADRRRTRVAMAAAILGTHHPRRARPACARGLRAYQPAQAWIGRARGGLAALVIPSIRATRVVVGGLGGFRGRRRVRRAAVARVSEAHPGLWVAPGPGCGLRPYPGYGRVARVSGAHPGPWVASVPGCGLWPYPGYGRSGTQTKLSPCV